MSDLLHDIAKLAGDIPPARDFSDFLRVCVLERAYALRIVRVRHLVRALTASLYNLRGARNLDNEGPIMAAAALSATNVRRRLLIFDVAKVLKDSPSADTLQLTHDGWLTIREALGSTTDRRFWEIDAALVRRAAVRVRVRNIPRTEAAMIMAREEMDHVGILAAWMLAFPEESQSRLNDIHSERVFRLAHADYPGIAVSVMEGGADRPVVLRSSPTRLHWRCRTIRTRW